MARTTYQYATDHASTYGVLIDVAELWERFVLHCATQAADDTVVHGTQETVDQYLLRSDVNPAASLGRLYPDILIGPSADYAECRAVIDARYKPLTDLRTWIEKVSIKCTLIG